MQPAARGRGAQLDSSFSRAFAKASLTAGATVAPAPLAGHCELQRVLLWAEAEVHPAVKYLKCKKPRALGEGRRQRPRQRKCKLPRGGGSRGLRVHFEQSIRPQSQRSKTVPERAEPPEAQGGKSQPGLEAAQIASAPVGTVLLKDRWHFLDPTGLLPFYRPGGSSAGHLLRHHTPHSQSVFPVRLGPKAPLGVSTYTAVSPLPLPVSGSLLLLPLASPVLWAALKTSLGVQDPSLLSQVTQHRAQNSLA